MYLSTWFLNPYNNDAYNTSTNINNKISNEIDKLPKEDSNVVKNPGESTKKIAGKESSPAECKTCSNRKYQDGSDEMVSFKSAAHISQNAAC